jgi:DNA-binding response OmpR family regulator
VNLPELQLKPLVLVVDDDDSVQKLVDMLLRRAGLDVVQAWNAAHAAQALKAKPRPDLVVLDLMLPDISGLELLRQMRGKEFFDDLPVVILSSLADADKIREGLAAGADRYVTKPYLANNLLPAVQDLLKNGRKKET